MTNFFDTHLKFSWLDYCASASDYTAENLVSLEIILVNSSELPVCVSRVTQSNILVVLSLEPMGINLVVIHHVTHVSYILQFKEPKVVVLNVFFLSHYGGTI